MEDEEIPHSRPTIPDIDGQEDVPPVENNNAERQLREEKRKDEKQKHELAKDRWITIAALGLALVLIAGYGVFVLIFREKDYTAQFLHLLSSSVMLVMGYLFGAGNGR